LAAPSAAAAAAVAAAAAQHYLDLSIANFFSTLPKSSQFTGDASLQNSIPTKPWLPEFEKKSSKRTSAQNARISKLARFQAKHLAEGLRALETLGHHPILRDGALLSTLRHRGWIDFGGAKYQTGFDTDPDVLMSSKSCTYLDKHPIVGAYRWKPYMTLSGYVKLHCESPRETIDFYKNKLGMNVEQSHGGELFLGSTRVADFSAYFDWKYPNSSIYPMCWRRIRNSKPRSSFALLVGRQDIFPVQHVPFYDYTVPIPNKAAALLKNQWGNDVLTTVRIKETSGRGSSADSYALPSGYAPAVPLGPCEPDTALREHDWYNAYAERVRMVRPIPDCPGCSMKSACARWWHSTPQRIYADLPVRKWNEERLRPKQHVFGEVRPCKDFGQKSVPSGRCSAPFQKLFDALDRVRAVYFPRSGTELGIVRGSMLLSADGDLDIYVDMPQRKLLEALKKELSPEPKLNGNGKTAEVHWRAQSGCPIVHMVYNDWISGELQHTDTVAADLCRCKMDSVELFCHRDGVKRMYTQYGPSWNVPLGIKQVDMPFWAQSHKSHSWVVSMRKKLKSLVSGKTGVIETVEGTDDPMALAQLNVLFDHEITSNDLWAC
jgi:hypothetical protein